MIGGEAYVPLPNCWICRTFPCLYA